jgi:hypothetical protein
LTAGQDEGLTVGTWCAADNASYRSRPFCDPAQKFALLEGAVHKRLTHPYLPPEAFAYIALYFRRSGTSGRTLVDGPEWRLFFLGPDAVERLFVESQQRGLLHYQAAGTVVRIDFPTRSLEEFAHALVERTH